MKARLVAQMTCERVRIGTKYGSPKLGCSVCGYGLGDRRWKFCPNCGCMIIEKPETPLEGQMSIEECIKEERS